MTSLAVLGRKWSYCETFVLKNIIKNLIIIWPIFTAQSVIIPIERASIKSRFCLLLVNMPTFIPSVLRPFSDFCVALGLPCLTKCASMHYLPALLKTFYFFYHISIKLFMVRFPIATSTVPDQSHALYRRLTHMATLTSSPSVSWLSVASEAVHAIPSWMACCAGIWPCRDQRPGLCTTGRSKQGVHSGRHAPSQKSLASELYQHA